MDMNQWAHEPRIAQQAKQWVQSYYGHIYMGVCIPEEMLVHCILPKKKGGRGFTSFKEFMNVEVQSFDKYLSESEE